MMSGRQAKVLVVAVLTVTMGLAGCAGTSPEEPTENGPGGDEDLDPPVEATTPRWNLGDEWTYEIQQPGFPTTTTSLIVYNQTANLYRLGVTDQKQSFIHALFDVNPFLGRIQKGNIGVFEDGKPRAMYNFPLTDGKTWTTEIFVSQHGGQLEAEASYNDAIETGIGQLPGYQIEATNADGFTVSYDYVPQLKWLSHLEVTLPNGTRVVEMSLEDFQANSTGTGYFVRGRGLGDFSYTPSDCSPTGCTDTVLVDGTESKRGGKGGMPFDLVAYNVQVFIEDPNNDKAQIQLQDGNDSTIYERTITQSQESEFSFNVVHQEGFAPGEWQIDVTLTGNAEAEVRLAGGWSFSGTVG